MKRAMTIVVVAVASAVAVLGRCASGVMTVGDGIVSDGVLQMLFCRPLTDCGAKKDATSSSASARTGPRSSGTFGGKEAT
jgi:hypothetical protein